MEDDETQESKTLLIFFSEDIACIISPVGYSQNTKSLAVEVLKLGVHLFLYVLDINYAGACLGLVLLDVTLLRTLSRWDGPDPLSAGAGAGTDRAALPRA